MNSDVFYCPPEDVAENFIAEYVDEDVIADFIKTAQALNLTENQAKGVWDFMIRGAASLCEEMNTLGDGYYETVQKMMRGRYGAAYAQKEKEIASLIKTYGGDGFAEFLMKTGLGNRRETVEFFMNLIDDLSEDETLAGEKNSPVASEAQISDEIRRLMSNQAYVQANHPEHKRCVEKVFNLRKRLFNED